MQTRSQKYSRENQALTLSCKDVQNVNGTNFKILILASSIHAFFTKSCIIKKKKQKNQQYAMCLLARQIVKPLSKSHFDEWVPLKAEFEMWFERLCCLHPWRSLKDKVLSNLGPALSSGCSRWLPRVHCSLHYSWFWCLGKANLKQTGQNRE